MTSDGPDAWCYDRLVARSWPPEGGDGLRLLRSLEVVWTRFDSNPAHFSNEIDGEQDLEDFLAGPPAVATPAAVLAEVRGYVVAARTPGGSTWLALEVAAAAAPLAVSWRLDGRDPAAFASPGPDYAGLYRGAPAPTRRGLRALVDPGPVEVHVTVSVRGAAAGPLVTVEARRTLEVPRHHGRIVRFELAATAPLTGRLADRAR